MAGSELTIEGVTPMKPGILPGAALSSVTLHLSIEGETWEGLKAEKEISRSFAPEAWPGLKQAVADLSEWGDCRPDTVVPFYGQLRHTLTNEHGHFQYLSREVLA